MLGGAAGSRAHYGPVGYPALAERQGVVRGRLEG